MNFPSPNLDALRSLAITFVVLSHLLLDRSLVDVGGYHTQTLGTLGVLIFFVHTCLVLMLSLERQAMKKKDAPTTLVFVVARAFRIYPLSILVVIVLSSIAWAYADDKPSAFTILSNIFLVQNLTGTASITPVLWSLPFEMQMYFFLPALYMLIGWSGRYAPGCIVALWCAMVALVAAFWHLGLNFSLIMFIPCFLPGVLAFSLRRPMRSLSPIFLFLYVAGVAFIYPWMVGHGVKAAALSWPICFVLGCIIPRCREIDSNWMRLAGSIVARYSYGIYLLHVPMLNISFHFLKGISPFASWAIFFSGLAGLSYCAYHVIEKPCTEVGRTIAARLNANRVHAGQTRWWMNF